MTNEILFERLNTDTTFYKDASDVVDYIINYKALLQSDTISSTVVTGENITIDSNSESGNKVTITASGGSEGATAKIKTTITTAASKVYERTFKVKICEL